MVLFFSYETRGTLYKDQYVVYGLIAKSDSRKHMKNEILINYGG